MKHFKLLLKEILSHKGLFFVTRPWQYVRNLPVFVSS